MQLRLHNLLPSGNSWSATTKRALCLILIFFQLMTPTLALAISPGKAAAVPEVAAALALTLEINRRMERASLNPMNENYRQDVRHAISLLPGAIIAIAGVFKAGKVLHNDDLPVVQALLGGFIDVSAPDRYKEFFKRPDKSLIPQLGVNIPSSIRPANLPPLPGMADKVEVGVAVASTGPVNMPSGDVVSLKDRWAPNRTQPVANPNLTSYGYDESNRKVAAGDELGNVSAVGGAGVSSAGATGVRAGSSESYGYDDKNAKSDGASAQFMEQVASDLSTIESRMAQVGVPVGMPMSTAPIARVVPVAPAAPSEVSSDNSNFFQKMKQDGDDEALQEEESPQAGSKKVAKKKKNISRSPASEAAKQYKIKLKPKYWNLAPLAEVMGAFLIPSAYAQCGGCQKGGQGEGGSAAEILMGIAAIIAAIAPMVVAGIQADADKAIAKINADTTIKTAQMQSDTSKFLANTQKDVALQQAAMSQQIAKSNNDAQSQRLNMQLAELRAAREDASKAEQEKRSIEQSYNRERIDLAKKQADDNLKLAKQTLNANLTQAGLVSGATAKNSASGLSVAKSGVTNTANRPSSNSLASGGILGGSTPNGPALGATRSLPTTTSGTGSLGVRQAAPTLSKAPTTTLSLSSANSRGAGANQLLSQFGGMPEPKTEEELLEEEERRRALRGGKFKRTARAVAPRSNYYSRGVASVTYGADAIRVSNQLQSSLAPGSSSRGAMNRIPVALNDTGNGLRDFREAATAGAVVVKPAVPYWKGVGDGDSHSGRAARPTATVAGGGHSANQDPHRGAYRAPDFGD